jgi:di/tricarboxylate transporter
MHQLAYNLIPDPSGFADNVASGTSSVVGQLEPLAFLIISVLLGALVIGLIISFFHHR